jgi:putative addiction module component (TIGR02574 family)
MSLAEIQNAVKNLSPDERAGLVAWILESLPEHTEEDAINESIAEAERREEEMESGVTKPISDGEFWSALKRERSQCG